MPIDVHVPGCPPRPEALAHGILRLRDKIHGRPPEGWRERYDAVGTEELLPGGRRPRQRADQRVSSPGTPPVPDATGLELTAQELRDADPESVLDTEFHRDRATLIAEPDAIKTVLQHLQAKGYTFLASLHGVDYYPEEPRLGVLYELLDMNNVDRITRQGARAHRRRPRSTRSSSCSPAPTSPSARCSTCSASCSTGHPDLRRILMPEDYEGHPAAPRLPDRRRAGAVHLQRRAELREVAVTLDRGLPQARGVDHALLRAGGRRRDPRAADAQHRAPPPGHARRAAPDRHARGRGRPRHQADHRLRPHRDREDRRGQVVLEGDPGHRADGLPQLLLQRDGVLRRGRDAARRRGTAARPVPARDPPRAQPDHVPPRVARHRARSTSARSRCSGTASASARRSSTCSRCPRASGCTPATSRSAA